MIVYSEAEQFFPTGYPLFDPEFKKPSASFELPNTFKQKPLEILGADARLSAILRQNIKRVIKETTEIEPKFKIVPLSQFEKTRVEGNYDFVAGSLPINDPNVEGALDFFFGLTPPIIPNAGPGDKDFKARYEIAKKITDSKQRNGEYRKIFNAAILEGSICLVKFSALFLLHKTGSLYLIGNQPHCLNLICSSTPIYRPHSTPSEGGLPTRPVYF